MKISLFVSGHPRTLFHNFSKNIEVIRQNVGECQIDVFYSLWDDTSRYDRINDPWHSYINSYEFKKLTIKSINDYFFECGADNVDGELETKCIMDLITEESPFKSQPTLSSQYYKTYRVVEKYFDSNYDFYLRIRPDIIINDFLSREKITQDDNEKTLFVNENYWYEAKYNGICANEMIWASKKDIFLQSNSLYLNQNKIKEQCEQGEIFGEHLTGRYFNSLVSFNIISSIETFNFNYRVLR